MTALCIDGNGDLDMRLRKAGDQTRHVVWNDLAGRDSGQFDVPQHRDQFFVVRGGDGSSVIRATSGTTTVQVRGTDRRCRRQITVELLTEGDVPPGRPGKSTSPIAITAASPKVLTLASGESGTTIVPGGYVSGQPRSTRWSAAPHTRPRSTTRAELLDNDQPEAGRDPGRPRRVRDRDARLRKRRQAWGHAARAADRAG